VLRLALANTLFDRARLIATIGGICFSVFLMLLEGSLLVGFIRTSSRLVDASQLDVWISAKGVACFECAAPIPDEIAEFAMGVPGTEAYRRIVYGQAFWKKPSGAGQLVIIVGSEPDRHAQLPSGTDSFSTDSVVVDRSNVEALAVQRAGDEVEINGQRVRIASITDNFGSFVGFPLVFTTYRTGLELLRYQHDAVHLAGLHLTPGTDAASVRDQLAARLEEVEVWTSADFSSSARWYWMIQTGAGGAILLAGLLAFIVGTAIVSQTTYAATMENIEEFATLKAMGATRGYIQGVVLHQALLTGITGSLVGLAASLPLVHGARGTVPWITTPWWLPLIIIGLCLVMACLAAVISIRKAVQVEPAKVFRA